MSPWREEGQVSGGAAHWRLQKGGKEVADKVLFCDDPNEHLFFVFLL